MEQNQDKREKMGKLKQRVCNSGLDVLNRYPASWKPGVSDASPQLPAAANLHVFGQWIFDHLWGFLKKNYMVSPTARRQGRAAAHAQQDSASASSVDEGAGWDQGASSDDNDNDSSNGGGTQHKGGAESAHAAMLPLNSHQLRAQALAETFVGREAELRQLHAFVHQRQTGPSVLHPHMCLQIARLSICT